MPDPTRPVAAAPIDTDWGQQVHDATFTPRGVRVAGGAATSVGNTTTGEQLQLNTAVDDPAGWLASDSLTVPAGAGGLYGYFIDVQTDNGSAADRTFIRLRVNSATHIGFFIDQEDTTAHTDARAGLIELSAGDVVNVYASKTGGLNPDVLVRSLAFLRLGTEIGA